MSRIETIEILVPGPPGGGLSQVVADTLYPAKGPTETALAQLTFAQFDVADPAYGAVRDSPAAATANVAAIQAAADDAKANDGVLVIKGTYHVDGTLTLACRVDASAGQLIATDEDINPVIRYGGLTALSAVRLTAVLPTVTTTKAGGPGVWGTGVGVELRHAYNCTVVVPFVANFGTNLLLATGTGASDATAYNEIVIGNLDNGKINLDVAPQSAGWCNENTFSGPFRLSHQSAEGSGVTGTRHIRMTGYGTGAGTNNCTFMSPSVEGAITEHAIELNTTQDALIIQGRWEAPTLSVLLHDAINNTFFYGYDASDIAFTVTGTSNYNHLYSRNKVHLIGTGNDGVMILENAGSSGDPALTIVPALTNLDGDPASAYTVALSAANASFKGTGDAFPRIEIDTGLGRINGGAGTADPNANYLRPIFASLWQCSTKFTAVGGIGVGNSVAATTPGGVVRKMEVFDANGASLGFVPIYDTIT